MRIYQTVWNKQRPINEGTCQSKIIFNDLSSKRK